jgi:hypothetical protein
MKKIKEYAFSTILDRALRPFDPIAFYGRRGDG